MQKKTWVLLGAGAVALYLLTRKKADAAPVKVPVGVKGLGYLGDVNQCNMVGALYNQPENATTLQAFRDACTATGGTPITNVGGGAPGAGQMMNGTCNCTNAAQTPATVQQYAYQMPYGFQYPQYGYPQQYGYQQPYGYQAPYGFGYQYGFSYPQYTEQQYYAGQGYNMAPQPSVEDVLS